MKTLKLHSGGTDLEVTIIPNFIPFFSYPRGVDSWQPFSVFKFGNVSLCRLTVEISNFVEGMLKNEDVGKWTMP